MKRSITTDASGATEARYRRAAGRQLVVFALIIVAAVTLLMFALSYAASLTSSGPGGIRGAVDLENNAISVYLRDEPPQLNSMLTTDAVSGQVLGHVMEGLLRYNEQGEISPGIAERWEIEGDTATFWLRENARWSNGDPITAHDFEFAWKTAVLPATASQYSFIFYAVKNAEAVNNGELPAEEMGVRALDDRTLEVTLEQPIAYFDRIVAFATYFPVQEAFYQQTGGRYGANARNLLSSGPFVISSWVHGSSMRLDKNPYYWNAERVQLDTINIAYMTSDSSTLLNLFKDGQIVMADLGAEMLEEAMLQGWQLDRFMDGTVFYADFNHREERLTSNWNLRMAMQLAQDSGELVNRVIKLPGYLPGESLFPVWLEGNERRFRDEYPAIVYERNTALAREHLQKALDELGLNRLPPLVLLSGDSPVARLQAEYYQEVFKNTLDIDLVIDAQIFRQRLAKMTAGDFDLVLAGWGPDYNDPLTFADLYTSWNLNNRGMYVNPELDRQVRIAQNSLVTRERMDAFGEIQRILLEDVVHIVNYERGLVYVTHPQVKGIVRRVFGAETDYSFAYIDPDA